MFAVADVTEGVIHAVVEIAAPPERVFEALTTPAQLAAWWGSATMYRTHDWKCDVRPGGEWSCIATTADGVTKSTVSGRYVEIDPPRRLEYTWNPSWDTGPETVIRYELEAIATGTRVKVVHRGFGDRVESCRGHEAGWNNVCGWLRDFLG